jgi:cytochrome c553
MKNPLRFPASAMAVALAGALCTPVATASDMSLGRSLAATCANCHGTNGQAKGDMKPLAGMSAAKLIALISDFRSGNQPATIMHQISKGYTDEQMQLIAAYFAAQKPAAN